MSKENVFEYGAGCGAMFSRGDTWRGHWSESGGAATHDVAFGTKDDALCVAFRKLGSKGWTYAAVVKATEDPAELDARAHKGYVLFKGRKLNIWFNYTKGHDGEAEHGRYDLKPVVIAARPL